MYPKDLSANVPLYGQEQCVWCGAASAQMIRNGYPNPADRLFYTQLFLWNRIQVHNSTNPADVLWATDPHGLTGCLQSLANPAGVHWTASRRVLRPTQTRVFETFWSCSPRGGLSPALSARSGLVQRRFVAASTMDDAPALPQAFPADAPSSSRAADVAMARDRR